MRLTTRGRLPALSPEGFIRNTASPYAIKAPWKPVIENIIEMMCQRFGASLHSIYVRGSVATGRAVIGLSDLDMIGVISEPATKEELRWRDELLHWLSPRTPFATSIELPLHSKARLLSEPRYERARFMLKTQSACVFGPSVTPEIPPFVISHSVAYCAKGLSEQLLIAYKELDNAEEATKVCRWIMKNLVRAGFDLVMVREGRYTRDLYPCYRTFSKYYPSRKCSMKEALKLAIQPTADAERTKLLMTELGLWIVDQWTLSMKETASSER